jgi:hypothetical protein
VRIARSVSEPELVPSELVDDVDLSGEVEGQDLQSLSARDERSQLVLSLLRPGPEPIQPVDGEPRSRSPTREHELVTGMLRARRFAEQGGEQLDAARHLLIRPRDRRGRELSPGSPRTGAARIPGGTASFAPDERASAAG